MAAAYTTTEAMCAVGIRSDGAEKIGLVTMKYRLIVRAISDNDTSASCPFVPDDQEVFARFHALVEDIANLALVKATETSGFEIIIELVKPVSPLELQGLMKPAFKQLFCFLRFVSLVPLQEPGT